MNSLENRTETILKTQLESTDSSVQANNPHDVEESLRLIDDLKYFLATAPANWQENQIIRRYYLNNEHGFVSCVFWNNVYYITGTDIVKCCLYRMQKFGRTIIQKKKFEEGIFSDLRNLKCGMDATLEQPKSEFLQFLYRNSCLKTQKKQKVFFWFSVPHDKLFTDALERDLKREETSKRQATTKAISEPAKSFRFDSKSGIRLYDQLLSHTYSKRLVVAENELDPLSELVPPGKSETPSQLDNSATVTKTNENKPTLSYDEVSNKLTEINSTPTVGVSEETLLPCESLLSIDSPALKLDLEKDSPERTSPATLEEVSPNNIDENDRLKDERINTTSFEDIPLDYFPIDIEYPDKNMTLEDSISGNYMQMGDYNMNPKSARRSIVKLKKHRKSVNYSSNIADPFILDQDDTTDFEPNNTELVNTATIKNELDQERINEAFNDMDEALDEFDNDISPQGNLYYNTQPQYHTYMNLNISQVPNIPAYQSDIMPQTIEQQPFGRFDNLYTPQSVYKDYFHMAQSQPQPPSAQQQIELFDWNTLLQPTASLPQLTTAHSINVYTPGYRTNPPRPVWVQSPYMTSGQNQYHQKKTPLVTRRRQFHNMTPAKGMSQYSKGGKMGRIGKQIHSKSSEISKEKQLVLQKRRR
ncbi:homeodomain transcription factor ste12 [Monosporozyma unispora]|nr:homeodomain transcription factor ste12 [Kazachstania unispora]